MPTDANPNQERRATLMFFTLPVARTRSVRCELPIIRRPLLNSSQVSSTRNSDGSYAQGFTLRK
jgi:hypothetical protein